VFDVERLKFGMNVAVMFFIGSAILKKISKELRGFLSVFTPA
jgi:hypothetical protein